MTSPRFLLRRGAAFSIILVLGASLAACGSTQVGDGADAGDTTGGGTVAVVDGVVELSAADLAFDAATITAPAGEAFTIRFTNNEAALHNVSVYTEEGGQAIATGEIIGEGVTTEVQVDALEAGEYHFVCDVHHDMNGTLVVEG